MLSKIIAFSVRNKLIIALLMIGWIAYGIFELTRLPIDAVPDITNNQVQVITSAPALGAQDVERFITFPIEQATGNIPGLKEIRSMSRFGLSLITIVFDDDANIYWARQQVTERLQGVEMPPGADHPNLAPVTTGLGEIYQYVVRPEKGYERKYSLADLRTVQDWIIRRQLLGTKGVADVSTFGGELKQYEVAINPDRLKSYNVTVSDLFNALHANNQNTGGAYIEKGPTVLFIRSEGLVANIPDIENIVVKTTSGNIPVLVRNIAEVRIGAATRYGALTYNAEGEVAGGIVMMLKGENSSSVIKNVKEKIVQIQKTLPEGLIIDPFLDRTKMVDNAISTVQTNLLEGALIVVLVLVLFLGNLRAGFVVASVIPLSMLFAVIMMNTFGVSGNLMSLGALDFGLIVDGAVIIVEAVLFHLVHSKKFTKEVNISQNEMDGAVVHSASRMMNAAVFGQIIILIVYLPVLSLEGIEGKMFKPMAQTVSFAILGAFILSLTYVPMMCAWLMNKKISHTNTLSDKAMNWLELRYVRMLERVMKFRKTVIVTAVALFAFSLFLFSTMGGEFIPQLEEGDYAVETRLLTGSNLTTTIKATQQMSKILLDSFPEVEKIVTRVGSAEIPTDPMPIEGGDVVIILKDKKDWVSAKSFNEMSEKMSKKAEAVPGITTGFQFPVQMRFNEMMTGAKQDVICKIFGEDLDTLAHYAELVGSITHTVEGTTDQYIETVNGMPQVVIAYKRNEIAKFGLNVSDINTVVNAAFAGAEAGQVYEGEKRFSLVVRLGIEGRKSVDDIKNLLIPTPSGIQIPLDQVAYIKETVGPNQIQRENAQRRIIVGFNVRGRDVQSIVDELHEKVSRQVKLPPGYYITYGGSFENLQLAKKRLMIAVPVAMLLILLLLYFAFGSLREGLLIYSAIPLSAIGGVIALFLRDMPFSISAGIGFIALFGVAVLNGIVLISEFNRLKKEGMNDNLRIIFQGTRSRLRPVLMTASVASLGFLPMALSNGAGAEVQRPLATVVIGGLVSATFLTLFVLPVLYLLMEKKMKRKKPVQAVVSMLFLLFAIPGFSQQPVTLEESVNIALKNNQRIRSVKLHERAAQQLEGTWFNINKTTVTAEYGKVNSAANDNKVSIGQTFSFPGVYNNQRKVLKEFHLSAQAASKLTELELKTEVSTLFYDIILLHEKRKLLQFADSLFSLFRGKSEQRFNAGEGNILERTTAISQKQQVENQLRMLDADIVIALNWFNTLLSDTITYVPQFRGSYPPLAGVARSAGGGPDPFATTIHSHPKLQSLQSIATTINSHPKLQSALHNTEAAKWQWKTERSKRLPDLILGYNNQTFTGWQKINGAERYFNTQNRFSSVIAGIEIPLFGQAQRSKAAAAKIEWLRMENERLRIQKQMSLEWQTASSRVKSLQENIRYYETQALPNTDIMQKSINDQLDKGEINYLQWFLLVNQVIGVRNEYLNAMNDYNRAIIQLDQFSNVN